MSRGLWIRILAVTATLAGLDLAGSMHPSAPRTLIQAFAAEDFPAELVTWVPREGNPVFKAEGPGHWDAKIRERGWILVEDGTFHLWFTGYEEKGSICQLGYATSPDGVHWTPSNENPLVRGHWVEDVMVVKRGDTYYMFAEGLHDHAQLLTSKDRVHWNREGTLDIRYTSGKPLTPGPFGTPTAWLENDTWHLFYERMDLGVWLATAKAGDGVPKVWTNVQDEPVMKPGPGDYDKTQIAMNQVIKYDGAYFAFYHGSGTLKSPRTWNTDVARSTDLIHWQKYERNPIVDHNKSSGIVVNDGGKLRFYTMHEVVDEYLPPRP